MSRSFKVVEGDLKKKSDKKNDNFKKFDSFESNQFQKSVSIS